MAINLLIVSTVHIAQQNDNKADVDQTNNGADSWLSAYIFSAEHAPKDNHAV